MGDLLCPGCRADLAWLPAERCPRCAQPTPMGAVCGACLKRPPAFAAALAVLRYDHPVDVLVQRLKYGGELALAGWFADLLAQSLPSQASPDLLIPMPLHPARLRQRGFNQAAEIGRALARRLKIPCQPDACRRLRDTPPQAGLPLDERRKNLRGAFACVTDLRDRRIALLDDVMTSGTSLEELAKTALKAGAAEVEVWAVARTCTR